jgi:putative ATPase
MNLAYKMRPQSLDEYVGQYHLVGKDKIIRKMIESDELFSMILWGPPGTGKTSLAYIVSKETQSDFHILSGVTSGKEDLKKVIEIAKENKMIGRRTILFIDEIHRWNKAQQDTLLPHVENGTLILIGATTENPSFEVIGALLSRSRIFVLQSLGKEDLERLIDRAFQHLVGEGLKPSPTITKEATELLMRLSGGDARIMLNALEISITHYKKQKIIPQIIEEVFQTKTAGLYDKKGEEHYNIISAYIKSMRGSDPDAALYYLARMLENGEDPKFIARRMIIFASEDVGLADRGALIQANAAFDAVTKIGMPEAQLTLAHITVYLAKAPKSRATTNALGKAKQAVYEYPEELVPLHLRNAPTKLMKDLGYAKNYEWSDAHVGPTDTRSFLPEKLKNKKFLE